MKKKKTKKKVGKVKPLKPCPFCGSQNLIWRGLVNIFAIICDDCRSAGSPCQGTDEAIDAWNKRCN